MAYKKLVQYNRDPVSTDDKTQGYVVGALWTNSVTGGLFVCKSNTTDAANWEEKAGSAKTTYSADADPTVDDDETQGYARFSQWINGTSKAVFICIDATEGAAVWI